MDPLSLVLISRCTHRPIAFHVMEDAVSSMINAVQDRKFGCNIFEYAMAFLSFDWLYFYRFGDSMGTKISRTLNIAIGIYVKYYL